MMIKLIATDMDGTFLRNDMSYDRNWFNRPYHQLQAHHVYWVIASGNQYFQLQSFFEDYPETIFVAENGAYIRDANHIYALNAFTPSIIHPILTQLEQIPDLKVSVSGQAGAYTLDTMDPAHLAIMRKYYPKLTLLRDYHELDDNILKFSIGCPPERTDAIVAELRSALAGVATPTSSGHGDIDLIRPNVNKAQGLALLGQKLGIDLSEMCAFGDGGNDLEMLQEVGLGVPMANADPRVAAVADATTTSNEEQGVLKFMETLLTTDQRHAVKSR